MRWKDKILSKMDIIQKEIPLCMEYETDARDVWPKRWERLKEFIIKELSSE